MKKKINKVWYVYILECSDGTLYTGITNNLDARLKAHSEGKGAKYTKGRGPFKVVFCNLERSKSMASKYEADIKKQSKKGKLELISYWSEGGRMTLYQAIQILQSEGWSTDGELEKNSDPTNNSVYMTWKKGDDQVSLGDFFLGSKKYHFMFPWAQLTGDGRVKTKKEFVAFLNGDYKTAFGK